MGQQEAYRRMRVTHKGNTDFIIKGQVTKSAASRLGRFPEESGIKAVIKRRTGGSCRTRKGVEPVFQPMEHCKQTSGGKKMFQTQPDLRDLDRQRAPSTKDQQAKVKNLERWTELNRTLFRPSVEC